MSLPAQPRDRIASGLSLREREAQVLQRWHQGEYEAEYQKWLGTLPANSLTACVFRMQKVRGVI